MASENISKLERLLNLTALLLDTRRPLTVEEIGEKMSGYPDDPASFRRQFERDKDELRNAGVPLEVVQLSGWDQSEYGYRIPPERYYLPDLGLDPEERAALQFALSAVALDGIDATEAGLKLDADGDDLDVLLVDGAPEAGSRLGRVATVSASSEVAILREAISQQRVVSFTYRGERRDVEPHRLDYLNGRWYLTGFDRGRDDLRCFRVDRLDDAPTTGEPGAFTAPGHTSSPRLEPWRFGDDPPTIATVRIDGDYAPLVRDRFGDDVEWTPLPDGTVEVRCRVSGRRAFRTLVLSMLDRAVIVGPEDLRAEFIAELEELAR